MASEQQVRGAIQFAGKVERATIGEQAKKEAQTMLANNKEKAKVSQDELVLVTGVVKNLQPCGIMLNKSHDWKGKFIAKPPDTTIGEHASGGFVHQGAPWQGTLPVVVGSKGSMIYGHIDNHAPPKLGWLLAWDKPDNPNELKRVYVEAGHLIRLMKIEWNEIEQKLDASRSTSHCWDSETGAVAAADIKDYGEKLTLLRASFDHSPSINTWVRRAAHRAILMKARISIIDGNFVKKNMIKKHGGGGRSCNGFTKT